MLEIHQITVKLNPGFEKFLLFIIPSIIKIVAFFVFDGETIECNRVISKTNFIIH
jgi:hypothetical protein